MEAKQRKNLSSHIVNENFSVMMGKTFLRAIKFLKQLRINQFISLLIKVLLFLFRCEDEFPQFCATLCNRQIFVCFREVKLCSFFCLDTRNMRGSAVNAIKCSRYRRRVPRMHLRVHCLRLHSQKEYIGAIKEHFRQHIKEVWKLIKWEIVGFSAIAVWMSLKEFHCTIGMLKEFLITNWTDVKLVWRERFRI